ncbi:endonuclease/exonuclease/phosphatase family protein [Paenibacillus sp.]|uniref:endonuclease/exonuclease/phosphatase family protein n=1 Tax=Paenibacillus sp. TaxID=58172 RepID=UPI002D63C2D4|nr:endonuclease/exonuclease/phosphatase family protein [Paenibacillus sp.]HZG87325.1 endonuclease/exonuclease/phosphatase family protein [Paenibacillus sp.]
MMTTMPAAGAGTTRAAVVMTFNLRRASLFDGYNAWRYRKGRAAEAIAAAEADFVGTQEGFRSMMAELNALLPGYAWLGEGRMGGAAGETNAILYRQDRWTPEESGTFWLSETPGRPGSRSWGAAYPRICTWALFRENADPTVRLAVFNTHLDHLSRAARQHGASLAGRRLLELRGRTGAPAVLTGDFNAKPSSGAIAQLAKPPFEFVHAFESYPGGTRAAGATYHGFRGGGRKGEPIDYIFASKPCRLLRTTVDREKYRGKYPSDHYPVFARLEWETS